MADDSIAAFPVSTIDGFTNEGMTLRDWFAGQVLAGIYASKYFAEHAHHSASDKMNCTDTGSARRAYAVADAMMRARIDSEGVNP